MKTRTVSSALRITLLVTATAALAFAGQAARPAHAVDFVVNTTADTDDTVCDPSPGGCTLREAIAAANVDFGPDRIKFSIPASDPGCDAEGVCTIGITSNLPQIADADLTIDGYTQDGASENTAALGQPIDAEIRVEMDGGGAALSGIIVSAARTVIRGLSMYGFQGGSAIVFAGRSSDSRLEGSFLGLNASGFAPPVGRSGVPSAPGNFVGVTVTQTTKSIPQPEDVIIGGPDAADRNIISLSNAEDITLLITRSAMVEGNYIGTDRTGAAPAHPEGPFGGFGIRMGNVSQNHTIARNVIAFHTLNGVRITGQGGPAVNNTIAENSIFGNNLGGIDLEFGGNNELPAPVITGLGSVSGTACPKCRIEVFSDEDDEGRIFEGATVADGAGNWMLNADPQGPKVTATATDANGNTSEFSESFAVVSRLQGDLDCDEDVDSVDALQGLRYVAGLGVFQEEECPEIGGFARAGAVAGGALQAFGDLDCDEDVDAVDALAILRFVAALPPFNQDEPCVDVGSPL